jgi:hypothetical protein
MGHITLGRNKAFTLPSMGCAGTPPGIDAIAHRDAGVGHIGAGITHAPLACFSQAVSAPAAELPPD